MINTDSLSIVLIGCFLAGLVFLLIASFTGGHHGLHQGHGVHIGNDGHVLHSPMHSAMHGTHGVNHISQHVSHAHDSNAHDFSLFTFINPMSIALFLLGFGFIGYVFHATGALALPLTLILATLAGIILAAVCLSLISRIFGDSEGATVQDVSDRTGLLGKVCITIPQNGLGEILYVSPGGMHKSIPARSVTGQRMERDQEVIVVNYHDGVAEVDTWEHFVNQDETTDTGHTDEDELATLRALLEESEKNYSNPNYVISQDSSKE